MWHVWWLQADMVLQDRGVISYPGGVLGHEWKGVIKQDGFRVWSLRDAEDPYLKEYGTEAVILIFAKKES